MGRALALEGSRGLVERRAETRVVLGQLLAGLVGISQLGLVVGNDALQRRGSRRGRGGVLGGGVRGLELELEVVDLGLVRLADGPLLVPR